LRNAKVAAWLFTTMNSYWILHASAQKITETTEPLKICNSFNSNRIHFKIESP